MAERPRMTDDGLGAPVEFVAGPEWLLEIARGAQADDDDEESAPVVEEPPDTVRYLDSDS